MGTVSQGQVESQAFHWWHLSKGVLKGGREQKEKKGGGGRDLSSVLLKEQFITKHLLETAFVALLPFLPLLAV